YSCALRNAQRAARITTPSQRERALGLSNRQVLFDINRSTSAEHTSEETERSEHVLPSCSATTTRRVRCIDLVVPRQSTPSCTRAHPAHRRRSANCQSQGRSNARLRSGPAPDVRLHNRDNPGGRATALSDHRYVRERIRGRGCVQTGRSGGLYAAAGTRNARRPYALG